MPTILDHDRELNGRVEEQSIAYNPSYLPLEKEEMAFDLNQERDIYPG